MSSIVLALSLIYVALLYFALVPNIGQKFGTYGQYNRVLEAAENIKGIKVPSSTVVRTLDVSNIGHVDKFIIRVKTTDGRIAEIAYEKDSDEMKERSKEEITKTLIRKIEKRIGEPISAGDVDVVQ